MSQCTRVMRRALTLAWLVPTLVVAQSASRGQELVETRCFACHGLDSNRVGPALRGVVGRRAGTAAEFTYSSALVAATHTWDRASPESLVQGQNMNYRLENAQDREDVVAYLTTLSVSE
jgi:cytochrome c